MPMDRINLDKRRPVRARTLLTAMAGRVVIPGLMAGKWGSKTLAMMIAKSASDAPSHNPAATLVTKVKVLKLNDGIFLRGRFLL
jgi:hypothetical protein